MGPGVTEGFCIDVFVGRILSAKIAVETAPAMIKLLPREIKIPQSV